MNSYSDCVTYLYIINPCTSKRKTRALCGQCRSRSDLHRACSLILDIYLTMRIYFPELNKFEIAIFLFFVTMDLIVPFHLYCTVKVNWWMERESQNVTWNTYLLLSQNNPCFPCNIAITNFLVSHTCKIIFHDVIDRTVHMFTS